MDEPKQNTGKLVPGQYRPPVVSSQFSVFNNEIPSKDERIFHQEKYANDKEGEDVIFEHWGTSANSHQKRETSFKAPIFQTGPQQEMQPILPLRTSGDEWFGSSIWREGPAKPLLPSLSASFQQNPIGVEEKSTVWTQEEKENGDHKGKEWWELDMERKILENLGIDFDEEVENPTGGRRDGIQVHSSADFDIRAKAIPKLINLGFPPDLCVHALEIHDGNVEAARNWLFSPKVAEGKKNGSENLGLQLNKDVHNSLWSSWTLLDPVSPEEKVKLDVLNEQEDRSWQEWEQKHRILLENSLQQSKVDKSLPVSAVPCKFYLSGYCKYGEKCPFLHEDKPKVNRDLSIDVFYQTPEPEKKSATICKFYATGSCRKGDKCPYIHEQPSTGGWPVNYKVTYIDGYVPSYTVPH